MPLSGKFEQALAVLTARGHDVQVDKFVMDPEGQILIRIDAIWFTLD